MCIISVRTIMLLLFSFTTHLSKRDSNAIYRIVSNLQSSGKGSFVQVQTIFKVFGGAFLYLEWIALNYCDYDLFVSSSSLPFFLVFSFSLSVEIRSRDYPDAHARLDSGAVRLESKTMGNTFLLILA